MHPRPSHPFARLRARPARVIVWALAVRARSRVSESAVHAFGRRDPKMRSDRRTALRTIQLRASVPRVLLARRCFGLTRCSSLVPRLAPRARSPRSAPANRPLDVAFAASRARAPEGSGPADAERGQGNARFTTREPPGESIDRAWGVFVLSRERRDCALGVSVASSASDRDRDCTERDRLRRPPRSNRCARS